MSGYQIYKNLAWLNELSETEARAIFLACCGSDEWARRMTFARPFRMIEDLFEKARNIWLDLHPADWLEAFAAHPRIGSSKPDSNQKEQEAAWSSAEQSGMNSASDEVREQMTVLNHLYAERFGFIFIICAAGKSADEMLAVCKARIRNSVETEMSIAANEQLKIAEIRLGKLLER